MALHLRYHNLSLHSTECGNSKWINNCASVLSMEPQFRNFFTFRGQVIRLPMAYTIWVFQYAVVPGGFRYPGVHGDGLRVLMSGQPLTSFDDIFGPSPTEHHVMGRACTDHRWDGFVFKSPRELMGTVLNIWWGSNHMFEHPMYPTGLTMDNWGKKTLETILECGWSDHRLRGYEPHSLRSILPHADRDRLIDKPIGTLPRRSLRQ